MGTGAGGLSRREMMVGMGLGTGALASLAVAGLPVTAVAAPATGHVPAWGPIYQDLGATIPNLAYVNVDGSNFHTYTYSPGRYLDPTSGVGHLAPGPNAWLSAPLRLDVGSLIHQVNVAYQGTPTIEISKRDFTAPTAWVSAATITLPAGGGPKTHTVDLASPVAIDQAASYSVQFLAANPGDSIYGLTLGYRPPTAGFVPFAGSVPRVLDTRQGGGKLGNTGEIVVDLANAGVRGALLNVTVTETEGLGFAAVFDASISYPGNSSVNWGAPGLTVANGVVSAVAANGRVRIRVGGTADAAAHLVVDRLGWFV